MVKGCMVRFMGVVMGVKGMGRGIGGGMVLLGLKEGVRGIIRIVIVGIVSIIVGFMMSMIIKKLNLMNLSLNVGRKKKKVKESV